MRVDHVCAASHLVIFVPGQGLGGEHKPVLLGSSLHDPDVVDGQPALPDHLGDAQTHHRDSITAPKRHIRRPGYVTHSFIYAAAREDTLRLGLKKQHRGVPLILFRSLLPSDLTLPTIHTHSTQSRCHLP